MFNRAPLLFCALLRFSFRESRLCKECEIDRGAAGYTVGILFGSAMNTILNAVLSAFAMF
jgi:hypothetical protein